jgi:shikimate dehydrogenase
MAHDPTAPLTICGSLSRYPVSLGRAMHLAGYEALGLAYTYVPFACRDVAGALAGIRALSIRGVGVSMPFKLDVLPHLDALDDYARRIGAVNTIVNDDGKLTGFNTDAIGARRALEEVTSLAGKRTLVLGAGGAARAVCVALADAGARLVIANRSRERAEELATLTGATARDEEEASRAADYDVVVNATSVGMKDVDARSPIPTEALRAGQVVMDIVYKPLETALVVAARGRGATVVRGERMLLFQAMEQFRLYTGREAPRGAMEGALLGVIS